MRGKMPTLNVAQKLYQNQRVEAKQVSGQRFDKLSNAVKMSATLINQMGLIRNMGVESLVRTDFLRFLLDGPRDIDAECGYPSILTPLHYQAMFDREGIAARVVNVEPEESWTMDPEVFEDEDETTDTPFEQALDKLVKDFDIWSMLCRIDAISGIGQYGILLMGIDDEANLNEPIEGVNDDGSFDESAAQHKLLYLRAFDETVVFVKVRETDTSNPRYGLPKVYTVQFRDFPNWGVQAGEIINRDIHWSRVIHVADNRKMSEVYGVPRMQQVYNRLYDLRKIYSSSGEAFWKGAFPGLSFEVNPELADQDPTVDQESLKKQMEAYQNGLQRYIATTGLSVKTLPPTLIDPTGSIEAHLKAIAISKGIPYRILFGSEEAKLAGSQDSRAWNKRVAKRQGKYVSPMIIRPFIDRLIAMGILPKPKDYFIEWPDLNAPTDQDKASIALTQTQAISAYVTSGASQLMPPLEFFTLVMGYTTEEAERLIEAAGDFQQDTGMDLGDDDEQDDTGSEGGLGDETQPDQGNALDQQNLGRETTVPKGGKTVEAQFIQMPSLNTEGLSNSQRKILLGVQETFVKNNARHNGKVNGNLVNGDNNGASAGRKRRVRKR